MKVVWPLGQASVRSVYEQIRQHRDVAQTTVQTMIAVLEVKGYLKKVPGSRPYLYAPTKPRQRVVGGMVQEFIARVFDGSTRPLLVHLLEAGSLTARERRALKRLLDDEA